MIYAEMFKKAPAFGFGLQFRFHIRAINLASENLSFKCTHSYFKEKRKQQQYNTTEHWSGSANSKL